MRRRFEILTRAMRVVVRHPADVVGLAILGIYALPSLWYPFAGDQPIHWYIGRRLLEGEMPYTSAISTKGPAAFVIHAIGIALFGESMAVVRWIDLFFLVATAVLAATFRAHVRGPNGARHLRPLRDGDLGAAAVLAGLFHYTYFDFSDTGHPELWLGFFMLASGWLIVRAPDFDVSWRRAFGAGVLACVAVAIKHVGVVTGVIAGVMAVAYGISRRGMKETARNALAYTAGVAAVLGLIVGVFWAAGAFDELWDLMVRHILLYAGAGIRQRPGPVPWLTGDHGLPAVVVALVAITVGLAITNVGRNRRERRVGLALLILFVGAFASVLIQRRAIFSSWFSYYWVALVPFLTAAVSWGMRVALPRHGRSQVLVAAALLCAAFVSAPKGNHIAAWNYRDEWASWRGYVRGQVSWRQYHEAHRTGPLDNYVHLEDIASYLRTRMQPGDTLCVDGFIVILYPLTGMRCPSRFLSGDFPDRYRPWIDELDRDLRERPPRFYVTFGTRPRVRQLRRRGWTMHELRYPDRAWYVVMERPR